MTELDLILAKRRKLVRQAAEQRGELAQAAAGLRKPAEWLDRGVAMAGRVREHPRLIMGVAGVLGFMLVRRGWAGPMLGVAMRAVRFVLPVARFWMGRR